MRYTFHVDTARARYPTELCTVRDLFNLRIPRCLPSQVSSHFKQIRHALARNRIQTPSDRLPFTLPLGPTCPRQGAILPETLLTSRSHRDRRLEEDYCRQSRNYG